MIDKTKNTLLILIFATTAFSFGCVPENSFWPSITNKKHDVWSDVRAHFTLPPQTNRPEVQSEIKRYLRQKKSLEKTLERATPYLYYIHNSIQQHHMPGELALVPLVESEYSPFAYSWAGATGLWQMMPGTASGLGLKINWWIDERRDIIKSTDAALRYLTYLRDFFDNNWLLAIVSYDAGAGRVQQAVKHAKNKKDFWSLELPKEAKKYLPKLLALREIIAHAQRYHVHLPNIANQPYFKKHIMHKPIALKTAANLAGISMTKIRLLNPSFRRWSTVPKGPYALLIPAKHFKQFIHNLNKHHATNAHKHLKKHRIQPGESLSSIAHKHHTSKQKIQAINQLKNSKIIAGQMLWVPKQVFLRLPGFTNKQTTKINADHSPGPKKTIYVTKKHDSLTQIAKKFNVDIRELRYWNQFKRNHQLKPGDPIMIWKRPRFSHGRRFYTVRQGDTLLGLAHQFHLSIAQLKHYNHTPKNQLRIGQTLRVR